MIENLSDHVRTGIESRTLPRRIYVLTPVNWSRLVLSGCTLDASFAAVTRGGARSPVLS